MTARLANIILSKPFGFVTDADMPAIVEADRLCWLLVRCGAQHGRFSAPAQNIAQLISTIEAAGDWVRDVSFPSYAIDEARAFVEALPKGHPDPMQLHRKNAGRQSVPHPLSDALSVSVHDATFDESCCSGAFDGFQVTSDADPGL